MLLVLLAAATVASPDARAKLATVEKALSTIVKSSPALADLVDPMVKEVDAALSSKDAAAVKHCLEQFPKWRQEMSKRQSDITSAGDDERTSLLVSVLQNRQGEPLSGQLAVVQSADFAGLPVADFIVAHQEEAGDKVPLVSLALRFLDGDKAAPVPAKEEVKKETKADMDKTLDGIVANLEKHVKVSANMVENMEKREKRLEEVFAKEAAKVSGKEAKFLAHQEKKEMRVIKKHLAQAQSTEKALSGAIADIKAKDMKGLLEAKEALQASMDAAKAEEGDFLHFLQLAAPAGTFSCPYCGAQCVEKCRTDEHKSYSGCLTECLAENPTAK